MGSQPVTFRTLLWTCLLLLGASSLAGAHAYLDSSFPAENATVASELNEVILRFTEPVEVPFSTFKVYPLASDEEDPVRLRAAASALVQQVLNLRNDAAQRADEGVTTQARISAEINIALKKELPPGRYVVMWRVLSIDTHTTTGFFVFTYAP